MLGQARSTHRHRAVVSDDEPRLVDRIIELATAYGRYGYRRITGLLRGEGWPVNHKRVERLWRREGLKVPQKQPKRGRLWLTDGSCIRRRPAYRHHVWAYDFVTARTHDGRPLKILTVIEEYSRECLAIVVARRLRSLEVLETLAELFVTHGPRDRRARRSVRREVGEGSVFVERQHVVGCGVRTLHPGRSDRHPGHTDTGHVGTLGQQPLDVVGRHVTLDDVSIDEGGVT